MGQIGRAVALLAAVLLSVPLAFPATVVDEATTIIYEIIDGTDEVRVYQEQSLQSYYGALTIPATVTDTNTTSPNYGKTYRVTSISKRAFHDCPMESMVIEAQVPEIPDGAFYYCYNLKSIVLPESITRICDEAFYNCYALESVTTGPNLKRIDIRAFYNCNQMTTFDMTQSTSLELIGEQAFQNCSKLVCPTLPDSLKKISKWAFAYCYALGDVTIPPVAEIQSEAFTSAHLTGLHFPETAGWSMTENTTSGNPGSQFRYATLPETVTIPASADYIPKYAFNNCYGLKKVIIGDNPDMRLGANSFYSYNIEEIEFQGSVGEIGERAFYGVNCTSIAVPPCKKIGKEAFANNSKLTSVTFPAEPISTADIGEDVFSNCTNLPEVTLPEWMETVPAGLFSGCRALANVGFPAKLHGINENAFRGCSLIEVTSETFPEGFEYVGNYAFYGAAKIGEIEFPVSLVWIGDGAFQNCTKLQLKNFEKLTSLFTIGKNAFRNCQALTSVKFPPNIKEVGKIAEWTYPEHTQQDGSGAFQDCKNLKEVVFNDGIKIGNYTFYRSGITKANWSENMTAGIFAFSLCPDLTEVTIPGSVETIPQAVFESSTGISSIKFNPGTKRIGDRAFAGTGLTYIDWGGDESTIVEIGHTAFQNCPLGRISFPASLKIIHENAFFDCGLQEVTIPATIEQIFSHVFACNPIKTINWPEFPDFDVTKATMDTDLPIMIGDGVFANTPLETVTLPSWMFKIPTGLFAQEPEGTNHTTYWADSNYGEFMQYFNGFKTEIEKSDVHYNSLKSIIFPEYVLAVGTEAFACNRSLIVGEFPRSIIWYGSECFKECGKDLTTESVTDPDSGETTEKEVYLGDIIARDDTEFDGEAFKDAKIRSIVFEGCATFGDGCFANMKYITEIEFPECLLRIPDGFCNGWSRLTDVRFRKQKVVEIGKEAFANCPVLNDIDFTTLPDLKLIDFKAFRNSSQSTVKFPAHPIHLGDSVFSFCKNLREVTLPAYLDTVPAGIFRDCPNLTTVKIEPRSNRFVVDYRAFYRTGLTQIEMPQTDLYLDMEVFAECPSLKTFTWPSNEHKVELSDEGHQFRQCTVLDMPSVPVSVTIIPRSMFEKCEGLTDIELPSVERVEDKAFYYSYVHNVSIGTNLPPRPLYIGVEAFSCTPSLDTLTLPNSPYAIGRDAFTSSNFKHFVVTDLDPEYRLNQIGEHAFYRCFYLEDFPDICAPGASVGREAFYFCRHLKRIMISPNVYHRYVNDGVFNGQGIGGELQSIVFYGSPFTIYGADVSAAHQLKALSYFRMPNPGDNFSISEPRLPNSYAGGASVARRTTPVKLMVPRATRYIFHEKGYQNVQLFDIEEIKDPQLELFGEIFSKFSVGENVNHYTGVLRWQMELSDLNDSGQTEYELWRDGKKVASFVFEAPELETNVSDGSVSAAKAISVAFHAYDPEGTDITDKLTYGDFYFEKSPNYFIPTIQTAQKKVYFNAESTARIGQTDGLGRSSWFLYKDNFDSPELDGFNVPVSHTYVLKMKNYDYMEWENYPDLIPDAEGKYYRKVPKRTGKPGEEWMVSEPCVVYTSIAHPSLAMDGLYTEEEVKADLERSLSVTTVPANATFALNYMIAGGACDHKVYDSTSPYGRYIVNSVQAYNLGSRDQQTTEGNAWGDPVTVNGEKQNMITGPEVAVIPGSTTFQTVTNADYRGSFGSPKVTLLGAPALELEVSEIEERPLHLHHDPYSRIRHFEIKFKPQAEMFGYDEQENPLTSDKYFVGLWRNVTTRDWSPTRASSEPVTESTLIWHSDGEVPQEWMDNCDYCKDGIGYDPATQTYTDRVKCINLTSSEVSYTARIYVKKPDEPNRYGIAEAAIANPPITTGIEDVTTDMSAEDIDYILANAQLYNLQGIQITDPDKGQIVIAIIDGRVLKLKI